MTSVGFGTPLLDVRGLEKRYPAKRTIFRKATSFVHAVDGVDLTIGIHVGIP